METKRGLFIVIEGLNGVGKGTLVNHISQWLTDRHQSFIRTREIGGTDFAEAIRGLVWSDMEMSEEVKTMAISAARLDHVQRVIKPALAEGKIVLCDRSYLSTLCFQGKLPITHGLIDMSMEGLQPDLMIILDAPVELMRERIDGRTRANGEKIASDQWSLAKMNELRKTVHEFHYQHSEDFTRLICAIPDAQTVFERAINEIEKLFVGTQYSTI
jgi:dTMP kinase